MKLRLTLILVLALALRIVALASLPRGLDSDEASNTWNAWCLLHTGHDEWAVRFPIIAERAFDDYRSTIYIYASIPFQLVGGMNEWTARLPALLGNVATAALLFYIARRMFDSSIALAAAGLFAVMPWNILVGRLAYEAALMPLEIAAVLALSIRAGVPIIDRPRPISLKAGLWAGSMIGLAMYGYGAIRIALPVTLGVIALLNAAACLRLLRSVAGRRLVCAISMPAILLVIPLIVAHLRNPDLNVRARENQVWNQASTVAGHTSLLLTRYAWHFGPEFLFARSTPNPIVAGPEGYAALQGFWLPLLIAGAGMTLIHLRRASMRTLLGLVLSFPAVDLFFGMTEQAHPLYSSLGMLALPMLAGLGWIAILEGFHLAGERARRVSGDERTRQESASKLAGYAKADANRRALNAAGMIVGAMFVVVFITRLIHDDRSPLTSFAKNTDLTEAASYVRSRLDSVDAVYFTQEHFVYTYAPLLAALKYDPARWLAEPREYAPARPPFQAHRTCTRFGKIWLIDNPGDIPLDSLKPGTRVLMVLRPDQAPLAGGHAPVLTISVSPISVLLIYEFTV